MFELKILGNYGADHNTMHETRRQLNRELASSRVHEIIRIVVKRNGKIVFSGPKEDLAGKRF